MPDNLYDRLSRELAHARAEGLVHVSGGVVDRNMRSSTRDHLVVLANLLRERREGPWVPTYTV